MDLSLEKALKERGISFERPDNEPTSPVHHSFSSAIATPEGVSESFSEVGGSHHVATAAGISGEWGIALGAVFVGLLIVSVVVLVHFRNSGTGRGKPAAFNVCSSEPCHAYATILRASLSDSVSPCDDFYAYVCQDIRRRGGSSTLPFLTQRQLLNDTVGTWLRSNSWSSDPEPTENAPLVRQLLRKCISSHESPDGSLEDLQNFLRSMNLTWPQIETTGSKTPDTLETLTRLSLLWNVDVWFSLKVYHVDSLTGKPVFELRSSQSYLDWVLKRKLLLKNGAYRPFLVSYVRAFGVVQGIGNIISSLNELEESVVAILGSSLNPGHRPKFVAVRVKSMALNDSDAPPLNWASSIARSFNVSASWFDSDNVWVEQLTFLSSINNLLKAEVERGNPYGLAIAWSVVRDLGRFVDGGLSQLYGMNTPDAIVYCVRKIEQVTRPALTLPLYDKPKTDRLFLHVSRIFRYVQLATSEVVTSNIWMDSGTKQRTLSAARRLALRFPLPVNSRTGNWNQRLSPLGNNRSFFEEWKAAQGWMQERLLLPDSASQAEDTLEEPRAALDHAKASVGLNLATLQPPLFAPSLPVAVRFGGLGRMLAHELMHALFGELTAGNVSKPADSWPSNADEHYEGRLACFARSYGRYHVTPGRIPLDPERFSDIASAPVLWDAFRQQYPPSSSSAPAPEDFRLPGMEAVDGRKLFFLAYCLTLCTEDEDVGSKSPGDFDHMPTPQQRCNVPLMHLEQFSSAFSCSRDDKMNPGSKCSFW